MEYEYLNPITFDMVKSKLLKREPKSHKGTFGKLLCVCGSKSMPGAAYFCLASAVRCGVGIVKSVVPRSIYTITASKIPEPLFCIVPEDKNGFISCDAIDIILNQSQDCSAVLAGCGMGWNKSTKTIIYELMCQPNMPMVIDADGINVISENIDILKRTESSLIITPHPKEMSRLIGKSVESILLNKVQYAKEFSQKYNVVTILKSDQTVIADPNGEVYMFKGGNAGMAKGGSGDVLSGMVGSFLAQGLDPVDAAVCATYIHAASGYKCAEKYSMTSMTPADLISELPNVFLRFEQRVIS